jgi:hypothetical protein
MAIWQYRLTLIPESVLLAKYEILPLSIPMELAEEFGWWSNSQPPAGFEQHISLILPEAKCWSTSVSMWGHEKGDDAYVCYVDASKQTVKEISFRVDARALSADVVRGICRLARELKCVLMTSEYEVLAPDESMVLTSINQSTAKKFVVDPVSTLKGLDHKKLRQRADYIMKRLKDEPPKGQ